MSIEKPTSAPEVPEELKETITLALKDGVDPNSLKKIIDEAARAAIVLDAQDRELRIEEDLRRFVADNRVRVTPEDVDFTGYLHEYWDDIPVGKALIKPMDPNKIWMYFKGSDNHLHLVKFDLSELLIVGEKLSRSDLQTILEEHSPFELVFKVTDFKGKKIQHGYLDITFVTNVEELIKAGIASKANEAGRIAEETRSALTERFKL